MSYPSFRAYKAQGKHCNAYMIESTAPRNIDDSNPDPLPHDPRLQAVVPASIVIDEIVDNLMLGDDPNLVIMVHGFNNPPQAVLKRYSEAFDTIDGDSALQNKPGQVFLGYRWPSEAMGSPRSTAISAAPYFLIGLFLFGTLCFILPPLFDYMDILNESFLTRALSRLFTDEWIKLIAYSVTASVGAFAIALCVCAVVLRIAVYFRDTYRASNYGVPDLVQVIQQIHDGLRKRECALAVSINRPERANWVKLTFIGHSMGGFVVTNVVRILSDVFSADSIRPDLDAGVAGHKASAPESQGDEAGRIYRFGRLILVSPDIPAETLISNRANFLESSLRRFEESHLFSNEADEVLRQISTSANYFSFPTRSRDFGYRLGNVKIVSNQYGVLGSGGAWALDMLQIGYLTLQQVYDRLVRQNQQFQDLIPKRFTYFDCTDYVEDGVGMLSLAQSGRPSRINGLIDPFRHVYLLVKYVLTGIPDVHTGYFDGHFSRELIFRLAFLGFDDTVRSYGGRKSFSAACVSRQIKVLPSPMA